MAERTEGNRAALEVCGRLGMGASVVMDRETHAPTVLRDSGTKSLRPLEDEPEESISGLLIEEIQIASVRSLHVAIYVLQNPTPENIDQALEELAHDCQEHYDWDTLRPLPVPPPHDWEISDV